MMDPQIVLLDNDIPLGHVLGLDMMVNQAHAGQEYYAVMVDFWIPKHQEKTVIASRDQVQRVIETHELWPFNQTGISSYVWHEGDFQMPGIAKSINGAYKTVESYTLQGQIFQWNPLGDVDAFVRCRAMLVAKYSQLDQIHMRHDAKIDTESIQLVPISNIAAFVTYDKMDKKKFINNTLALNWREFDHVDASGATLTRQVIGAASDHIPFHLVEPYGDYVSASIHDPQENVTEFKQIEITNRNQLMSKSQIDTTFIDYRDQNFEKMWLGCWFIVRCPEQHGAITLVDPEDIVTHKRYTSSDWSKTLVDWISPTMDEHHIDIPLVGAPQTNVMVLHPWRRFETREPKMTPHIVAYVDEGKFDPLMLKWNSKTTTLDHQTGVISERYTKKFPDDYVDCANQGVIKLGGDLVPFMVWDMRCQSGHEFHQGFRLCPDELSALSDDIARVPGDVMVCERNKTSRMNAFLGFDLQYPKCTRFQILLAPHGNGSVPNNSLYHASTPWEIKTREHDFHDAQPYFYQWLHVSKNDMESMVLRHNTKTVTGTGTHLRGYGMGYDAQGQLVCTFRLMA